MGFIIFKALKTNHSGLSQTNQGGLFQTNHGALLQAIHGGLSQTNTIVVFIAAQRLLVADVEGLYIFRYQHTEITLTQEK